MAVMARDCPNDSEDCSILVSPGKRRWVKLPKTASVVRDQTTGLARQPTMCEQYQKPFGTPRNRKFVDSIHVRWISNLKSAQIARPGRRHRVIAPFTSSVWDRIDRNFTKARGQAS